MKSPTGSFEIIMLIKEVYTSMHSQIACHMKESGLTPQQVMVIKIIGHEKEVTISRLCEEMSLAKATVSGIVQRLEDAGYVEKLKKATDKRNTYIVFSEQGNKLAKEWREKMNESFCKVFEHLSEEEMEQIKESLKLLNKKIKEQHE